MSIDLEWLKLDASLANHLVDLLNRQLEKAERPSFMGLVQVKSLDFGSNAPDVELVDLRDIYRDFLEDDDCEDHGPVKVTEGGIPGTAFEDEEGYEWVSRRAGVRREPAGSDHFLHPHLRHHGYGIPGDYFSATSTSNVDSWALRNARPPSSGTYGMYTFSASTGTDIPLYRSPSPATPFVPTSSSPRAHFPEKDVPNDSPDVPFSEPPPPSHSAPQDTKTSPATEQPHPNLQLHLHINWHSNLRISIQTSLLINYPSPMFMSLPIRLSITGLVFNGELAVAYEGERKRIHLCILDDLDPYGPAASRRISKLDSESNSSLNSNSPSTGGAGVDGLLKDRSNTSTPPGLDDSGIIGIASLGLSGFHSLGVVNNELSPSHPKANTSTANVQSSGPSSSEMPLGYNPVAHTRPTKPVLPVGQRLLPSIFIESEIGQADKHVLKNVTRVERFIQDVIRKTVEEELVFPNFHTLAMGES